MWIPFLSFTNLSHVVHAGWGLITEGVCLLDVPCSKEVYGLFLFIPLPLLTAKILLDLCAAPSLLPFLRNEASAVLPGTFVLPVPEAICGHFWLSQLGVEVLLASSGWVVQMQLSILQCTGQSLARKCSHAYHVSDAQVEIPALKMHSWQEGPQPPCLQVHFPSPLPYFIHLSFRKTGICLPFVSCHLCLGQCPAPSRSSVHLNKAWMSWGPWGPPAAHQRGNCSSFLCRQHGAQEGDEMRIFFLYLLG